MRIKPGPGAGLFVDDPSPTVRLGNSMMALNKDAVSFPDAVRLCDAIDPLLVDDALKHVRGRTSEPCGLS